MAETLSATVPFGASELKLGSGRLAGQAAGAVLARHGDTVVLATVGLSNKPREGTDFFPLTVDYEERMYAAGKISGSKFIKRENRPSEAAILKGRLGDRALRPMFPKTFRREVQVILTTLSYDDEHDPAVPAIVAASAALMQTEAPFAGPIGAARVGLIEDKLVLNPTETELKTATLDLVAAGTGQRLTMIEAAANEVPEAKVLEAIEFAHRAIKEQLTPQETFAAKRQEETAHQEPAVFALVKEKAAGELNKIVKEVDSQDRKVMLEQLTAKLTDEFQDEHPALEISQAVDTAFFQAIRHLILDEGARPDGRALDEIRPLSVEVAVLPRVHGSALFSRGETQAMTIATLAGPGAELWIDTMVEDARKRYMHYYNFPPFSVGEVKPLRAGGRREIGHGALAEKALLPVLPTKEEFPYTIRLVSEILSSNGSSSMAAVCGSTLALMDAGVPIRKPVAGVAMGLVASEDAKTYRLLTDLQGLEDYAGEMDFKIAGTADGITAIQLDVKNAGLTEEIIRDTVTTALAARGKILAKMNEVIASPRAELSSFAPRIISTQIDPAKIGELIGPGGKTINKIIDEHGGKEVMSVDIEDDGTVMITSTDAAAATKVKEIVEGIAKEIEVGAEFEGPIVSIVKDRNSGKEIGAIVQLTPNRDGMIHISAIGTGQFVERVSDVVKVGDSLKVKVKDVDPEKGRISLVRI